MWFFQWLAFLVCLYSLSLVMCQIAQQQPALSPGSVLSGSTALVVRRTTVVVTTASALLAAIASDVTIELGADIYLNSTIDINGQTNLKIDGKGFKVDGGGSVQCFNIQGTSTEVEIIDLTVTNGYGVSSALNQSGLMFVCLCLAVVTSLNSPPSTPGFGCIETNTGQILL